MNAVYLLAIIATAIAPPVYASLSIDEMARRPGYCGFLFVWPLVVLLTLPLLGLTGLSTTLLVVSVTIIATTAACAASLYYRRRG